MKVISFLLAVVCLHGQTTMGSRTSATGSTMDFSPGKTKPFGTSTVAGLPSAASNSGVTYLVTDGTSASDCSAGGGSTRTLCHSNGSAWSSLGGGGGGGSSSGFFLALGGGPGTDAYESMIPVLGSCPVSYVGVVLTFVPVTVANTGPSSLDFCALGAKAIRRQNGTQDTITGDLLVDRTYTLRWVAGAPDFWQIEQTTIQYMPRNAQTGTTYTVLDTDVPKLLTFSNASPIAVTLPQAGLSSRIDGWWFVAKNIGAGTVTITPTTSTISGAAAITLETGEWAWVTSDGANYEATTNRLIAGSNVTMSKTRLATTINSGGGASSVSQLTDCTVTAPASVITLLAGCTVKRGPEAALTTVGATPTITPSAGTGTVYIGFNGTTGLFTAWHNVTAACGAGLTCVGSTSSRPVDALIFASVVVTAGAAGAITDERSLQVVNSVIAGSGLQESYTNGIKTLSLSGSSATASGPYLSLGGTKYLASFMRPVTVPPTLTIVNTAGSSTLNANADGSYTLISAPVASDNLVAVGASMGANTQLTTAFSCNMPWTGAATYRCGFGMREAATGKMLLFEYEAVQGSHSVGVAILAWTNQTTYAGAAIQGYTLSGLSGAPIWFGKVYTSGGNSCFQVSNNGVTYSEAKCGTTATYFTTAPDQFVLFASPGQTVQSYDLEILDWTVQ